MVQLKYKKYLHSHRDGDNDFTVGRQYVYYITLKYQKLKGQTFT